MIVDNYHVPVMLQECIEGLQLHDGGVYVDVTFGGGGHSKAIMTHMGAASHLYGFDQDPDAAERARSLTSCYQPAGAFTFICSNFRYLRNWMRYYGITHIDGLLADLGVSSHHLDEADRGFAFRFDAPLDMRMNNRAGQTAADLLATADVAGLTRIFTLYGELRQARRLAEAIDRRRTLSPLLTTGDLLQTVQPLMNPKAEKKELAQVFQALRIEVNHEMDALQEMLQAACELVSGRLVVLTYHSLEDRIVKNFIKAGNAEGTIEKDFYGRALTPLKAVGKMQVPTDEEVAANPRARSAKLRIATVNTPS